jgi:hypothetical protein
LNYLINESPLMVLPTLACMLGLNEAIVIQQIHYWLGISKNEIDGKKWVFNTYQDWQKQFPWWSLDTVRRTFKNLEKLGVLETDNYNKMNIDRTKWYTINYQRLQEISENGKLPSPIWQNAQMEMASCTDGCVQNAQTNNHILPNTTSDISTDRDTSPIGDQSDSSGDRKSKTAQEIIDYFNAVWEDIHPRGCTLTPKRKKQILARLKTFGLDTIKRAIDNLYKSPWHVGDNPSGWKATIDFLIRSDEQVDTWANNPPMSLSNARTNQPNAKKGSDPYAEIYL